MSQKDAESDLKVVVIKGKKIYRCGKLRFDKPMIKDIKNEKRTN